MVRAGAPASLQTTRALRREPVAPVSTWGAIAVRRAELPEAAEPAATAATALVALRATLEPRVTVAEAGTSESLWLRRFGNRFGG